MSDGRCLSHAYSEMHRRDNLKEPVLYVQGSIIEPLTGKRIKHAWVESKGIVIDPTIDLIMKKEDYYKRLSAKDIIRMETFIATMLFGRELHFVTKEEVAKAVKRDKELMAQILARRKKK